MRHNWTDSLNRLASRYFIGVFVLILLVAAVLRLWGLPGIPPGPHYDEAANGILAAEIAKGVKTPIFISSYTGKEVLFFYTVAAAMRLLGIGTLALRLTSALVGILTVAATAWMAYELFADAEPDGAPWLAALTAMLLATSFWHVVLSRIGFRAITQPLLQALTLAALWRGLRGNDRWWLLLGGVACGITGYTYLAARVFPIPLATSLIALLALDAGHRRPRLIQYVWFGLAALVSFVPLGLYYARTPDAFTTRMSQVGPDGDWNAALRGVVAAFKMLFLRGDPYIRFNLPFRPLFGLVVAFLLVVGVILTIWRLFRPRESAESPALERARETLLLTWIPVMLLPTALAVKEITPSNLRAVGLIPLVFVFPARGLWTLLSATQHATRITHHAALIAMCLLLLATSFVTARAYFDEYAPRTDLYEASDGDLADIAAFLNQTDLTDTSVYVGSIHYRHPTLAFLAKAYPQIKWLVSASTAVYPASSKALYLFPRSAPPDVEWFAQHLPDAVPIAPPTATDGAPAFNGYYLASLPHLFDAALADFAGIVRLLDYRVERAASGAEADVTVVWQILAPPPDPRLTPFYHLVDRWGNRWGQAEPFKYAAEDWTPGEIVMDRVRVPIAPGAPPGEYSLETGLYSQYTDTRLAVIDTNGSFAGTTVPLTLTVGRAETPPDPETLGIRQRLSLDTDAGLALLGANLDTMRARPGERVHLTLFWQANRNFGESPLDQRADYAVHLFMQDVGGDDVAIYEGGPVHGTYPTSRWTDGEIIVDRYNQRLPLAAADAPPGDYPLVLVMTAQDGETLVGPIVLGALKLAATDRTFDVPPVVHAERAAFADQIELLGYDIDLANARPGGSIALTLYWRALVEMDTSYTVFTHLLGPDGQIVAQQDNIPINGTYRTTLWLPGEIVTDPYNISLPPDLSPGEYPIEIGFYIAESGLRLGKPIVLDTPVTIQP